MLQRFNLVENLLAVEDDSLHKIAIVDDTKSITYQELKEAVLIAAANLYKQGLRPGNRYIIMMSDSVEWLCSFLGGLYLGAVPVLLPVIAHLHRCNHVINESQAKLIVCDSDNALEFSDTSCIKLFTVLESSITDVPDLYRFEEQEPSLWLSSSGTGGKMPKLAVHPHCSLQSSVDMMTQFYGSDQNNCVFSTAKLSFQYGLFNVLYGINQRATLILTKKIPSAKLICELVSKHQVTQLFSTPGVILGLSKSTTMRHALNSVDILVSAGEVLIEDIEAKILEIYGKRVYNAYGMAEAIIVITGQNHQHNKFQTIGIPFPGVTVKIVDNELNEVPDGEIGELLIYTPTRALGYHNDTETSTYAFLADGSYRSNDLGYIDQDGMLCYVGRKNDCFKINGMFVTPVEVENAIMKYPGVEDCMVASTSRLDGKLVIVANIVLAEQDQKLNLGNLRKFLGTLIEQYKIPQVINFVTEIPRTPTTKKIRSKIIC